MAVVMVMVSGRCSKVVGAGVDAVVMTIVVMEGSGDDDSTTALLHGGGA